MFTGMCPHTGISWETKTAPEIFTDEERVKQNKSEKKRLKELFEQRKADLDAKKLEHDQKMKIAREEFDKYRNNLFVRITNFFAVDNFDMFLWKNYHQQWTAEIRNKFELVHICFNPEPVQYYLSPVSGERVYFLDDKTEKLAEEWHYCAYKEE